MTTFVFDHIYKTAGTTFNLSYLPAAFEPQELFVVRGMLEPNREDLNRLRALNEEESRRLRMIAGHNTGQLRSAFRHAKYLTLVREPTARAISGYLHALYHTGAFEFIGRELQENNIGFSQFIEQDLFARRYADFVSLHDWQAKVLIGAENLSTMRLNREAVIEAVRSRFHLVGYTEAFEKFLFFLHVTEGFPLVLFQNRLVRPAQQSFRTTETDLARIELYSRLDRFVYDCVREEFDARISAIWTSSLAEKYEEYIHALNEFRKDADEKSSVRFQCTSRC